MWTTFSVKGADVFGRLTPFLLFPLKSDSVPISCKRLVQRIYKALEFNLQTCLKDGERIVLEGCIIGCTGDRTTYTPDHIFVEIVVEG
mgnify:FL=1